MVPDGQTGGRRASRARHGSQPPPSASAAHGRPSEVAGQETEQIQTAADPGDCFTSLDVGVGVRLTMGRHKSGFMTSPLTSYTYGV